MEFLNNDIIGTHIKIVHLWFRAMNEISMEIIM